MTEDNTQPMRWSLARVTKEIHVKDGVARVMDVLTTNGLFRLPAVKLCCLPLELTDEASQGGRHVRNFVWIPRKNPQMKNKLFSILQTQRIRRIEVRIFLRISKQNESHRAQTLPEAPLPNVSASEVSPFSVSISIGATFQQTLQQLELRKQQASPALTVGHRFDDCQATPEESTCSHPISLCNSLSESCRLK